MITWN